MIYQLIQSFANQYILLVQSSVMVQNAQFFNRNVETYDNKYNPCKDYTNFILLDYTKRCKTFLDVGGGTGLFSRAIIGNIQGAEVTVMDPSENMLEQISDEKITKIIGELPNKLNVDNKFDCVHVMNVLHHVVGNTVSESRQLQNQSIQAMSSLLNDNGILIIRETIIESYIVPSFARSIIFNLLKIQSYGLKIPSKMFLEGLQVCFITQDELISTLEGNGFDIIYNHLYLHDRSPIIKRIMFSFVETLGYITTVSKFINI